VSTVNEARPQAKGQLPSMADVLVERSNLSLMVGIPFFSEPIH
jgi:hypothetical protein